MLPTFESQKAVKAEMSHQTHKNRNKLKMQSVFSDFHGTFFLLAHLLRKKESEVGLRDRLIFHYKTHLTKYNRINDS